MPYNIREQRTKQQRILQTPEETWTYLLCHKSIKNLNLRVTPKGEIVVSVPMRCSVQQADAFVLGKSNWLRKVLARQVREELLPEPAREVSFQLLQQSVERMYPLVSPFGVPFPMLKVRRMKSQWGNCHWRQGYITLNLALIRCPEELRDYVALHELVHFLYHDHGAGFYACMGQLMPDWKLRRQKLKGFALALDRSGPASFDGD